MRIRSDAPASALEPTVKHDAFISYSRRNEAFASKLEEALENYRPPKGLHASQRHLDIFRDRGDFTAGEYFQKLEKHLEDSAKLIIICSPDARKSQYVNDEIQRFARKRGAVHIIPILLSGVPNNEAKPGQESEMAFPDALCEVMEMPLAASYQGFNPQRDKINKDAFSGAWYATLAELYGVSRREIEQREKKRQARARRIAAGVISGMIATLSVMLVWALISRQQAVEARESERVQRRIAEVARDQAEMATEAERKSKDQERAARLAEERQRKLAEEQRREAVRQREAARREAIAARRETANRLATQALEKLDGAPEKALRLAIAAVETFHSHRDPLAPEAVAALQKVMLSFGGGRPLFPHSHWPESRDSLVIDPTLRWIAASDRAGDIFFGAAGTSAPQRLTPPGDAMAGGERWANSETKLVLGRDRIFAARRIASASPNKYGRTVIWFWKIAADGAVERAVTLNKFPPGGWSVDHLRLSPDERWLSWSDGSDQVYLQAADPTGPSLSEKCQSGTNCVNAFSDDSKMFFVESPGAINRFALSDAGGPDHLSIARMAPINTMIPDVNSFATFAPERGGGGNQDGRIGARLAILGTNGDVEWWEVSGAAPVRHQLPNLFSAYRDLMDIFGLERGDIRADLQFSPDGSGLLASVAEASGEFGLAAVHRLDDPSGWRRLLHRYEGKYLSHITRAQGSPGVVQGYRLKDISNLGVSSALWLTPEGALTLGFDGTLLFRQLDDQKSGQFMLVATGASCATFVGKWIVAGGRDGKVRIWDVKKDIDKDPPLELNGHDAPVREVRATWNLSRIVSIDEAGTARIWRMDNPVLRAEDVKTVSSDGNWLISEPSNSERPTGPPLRFWRLGGPEPLSSPGGPEGFAGAKVVAIDHQASWAATLHLELSIPRQVRVGLWSLRGGAMSRQPHLERRLALDAPDQFTTWTMKLAVSEKEAPLIISAKDLRESRVWIGDLFKPDQPFTRIGGATARIRGASPDLRWLILGSDPQPGLKESLQLVDLRRRTPVQSKTIQLNGVDLDYVNGFSADNRWLILTGRPWKKYLIDLDSVGSSGRLDQPVEVSRSGDLAMARRQPPLFLDENGDLLMVSSSSGAPAAVEKVTTDQKLSALAWDEDSEWLALGRKDGRASLARVSRIGSPADLRRKLQRALAAQGLPLPAEPERGGKITRIFPFPAKGWVIADTEKDSILIWRRAPDGAWGPPLVFSQRELRIDWLSDVRFQADGRMALLGGQLVSLDPEQLISYGRKLLSGPAGGKGLK